MANPSNASPLVAIAMGSSSDLETMRPAADVLRSLGIPCELRILSAHRTPALAAAFAREARSRGVRVLIAGAGAAAHLAGALAAQTTLPVIGVPLASSALAGFDSLLATVQMPRGVPVATVAVGGAANAALLAAQILALSDEGLTTRLDEMRAAELRKLESADEDLRKNG
jgi:5-(carboxyamino)imidazole ribonucleotide mutase